MPDYITREDLIAALTETHERTITPALFGGRAVLIRELTARQRTAANEAALKENPDSPDNALYRAMFIQMSVVDPKSGQPYADGRTDDDGQPVIDPRTRRPLLTIDDILNIADGRNALTEELIEAITELGKLAPRHLFRGDSAADGAQRDADKGNPVGRRRDRRAAGEGSVGSDE